MASTYLSRTPGSAGNRKTWTWSGWVKKANVGGDRFEMFSGGTGTTDTTVFELQFKSDTIRTVGYNTIFLQTNAVYRDPSAWYHVVLEFDVTQATASDRMKLYVNGEEVTSFSTDNRSSLTQNTDHGINQSALHTVGRYSAGDNFHFDGSMAHVHFIDGTAYDASAFGETDSTTGQWTFKSSPSVTYGTNGFFLKFANSGSMGTDSSGNGNNFTVAAGTLTQTQDTPDNVFCSMLATAPGASTLLSNLNLTVTKAASSHSSVPGSLAVNTGKWYFEAKANTVGPTVNATAVGIARIDSDAFYASGHNAGDTNDYVYTAGAEQQVNASTSSYGNTYTSGDIIGVAFDLDNNKLYFSKNGTYQNSGVPTSGSTGTGAISITPGDYFTALAGAYGGTVWDFNFGNGYFGTTAVSSANSDGAGYGLFEYAPPTGYYSLCTKNINTYG